MSLFLAVILLVLVATATMAAFGGDTWVKGTEPLLKRVTWRGWVSLSCLVGALVLGIVKEIRSASAGEQATKDLSRARAEAEAAKAEAAKAALPKPPKTPTDLRVWRDTEAEQLCKDLRIEAYCFKYEGGWVDCWIDIDGFGPVAKPERLEAEGIKKSLAGLLKDAVHQPSGSFVWIRRLVDKEKEEQLAFRASVKFSVKPPDGVIDIRTNNASISSLTDPWRGRLKGNERLERGKAEVVLRGDEVVTLVTILTAGEKEGEVSRTLKLQCKALK
jgi:hypothetical protein